MEQQERLDLALGVFEPCRTAKDVGARLKRYGVRGVRRSRSFCPVANYLRTYFFPGKQITVDGRLVSVYRGQEVVLQARVPDAVYAFIAQFDDGRIYPSLATGVARPHYWGSVGSVTHYNFAPSNTLKYYDKQSV